MVDSSPQSEIVELKRKRRYAEALALLEKLVAANPNSLYWKASMADLLVRMRRLDQAGCVIDEILTEAPDHVGGLTARAELFLARHDRTGALALLELALASSRVASGKPSAYVARRQAQILTQLGRLEEAAVLVSEALDAHPGEPKLGADMALLLKRTGKIEAARDLAERLAASHPKDPNVRRILLEIRAEGRPPEEVSRELDRALSSAIGRSDLDLWTLKARKAAEAGLWEESAKSFLACYRLDPTQRFALKQAGFAFKKAGDLQSAIECLKPCFVDDPLDLFVRNCVFSLVRSERGPSATVELIDQALGRHPELHLLHGLKRMEQKRSARPKTAARSGKTRPRRENP